MVLEGSIICTKEEAQAAGKKERKNESRPLTVPFMFVSFFLNNFSYGLFARRMYLLASVRKT